MNTGYVVGTIKGQPREQVKSQIVEASFLIFGSTDTPLRIITLAAGIYGSDARPMIKDPCASRFMDHPAAAA